MLRKPKVIVFDLDNTLWPFYVDSSVTPPFSLDLEGNVVDKENQKMNSFPDAPEILSTLHSAGYTLAIASRIIHEERALSLMQLLGWDKYFSVMEIHPGFKVTHLRNIIAQTGVEGKDILFFDDNPRNVTDVRGLGVFCVLTPRGVNNNLISAGLKQFSAQPL